MAMSPPTKLTILQQNFEIQNEKSPNIRYLLKQKDFSRQLSRKIPNINALNSPIKGIDYKIIFKINIHVFVSFKIYITPRHILGQDQYRIKIFSEDETRN